MLINKLCILGLIFCSCNTTQKENDKAPASKGIHIDSFYIDSSEIGGGEPYRQYPDTSNHAVYEFMKIAIASMKLDTSYGLLPDPSQYLSIEYNDKKFLRSLLVKRQAPVKKYIPNMVLADTGYSFIPDTNYGLIVNSDYWTNLEFHPYDKCLTRADINVMLKQKEMNKDLRWDNNRLGFDTSNHKNFYCFSVPVFSVDSTKVIMMISDLCPGLCGTSQTVLFKKQKDKWITQSGFPAYH